MSAIDNSWLVVEWHKHMLLIGGTFRKCNLQPATWDANHIPLLFIHIYSISPLSCRFRFFPSHLMPFPSSNITSSHFVAIFFSSFHFISSHVSITETDFISSPFASYHLISTHLVCFSHRLSHTFIFPFMSSATFAYGRWSKATLVNSRGSLVHPHAKPLQ